MSLKESKMII